MESSSAHPLTPTPGKFVCDVSPPCVLGHFFCTARIESQLASAMSFVNLGVLPIGRVARHSIILPVIVTRTDPFYLHENGYGHSSQREIKKIAKDSGR